MAKESIHYQLGYMKAQLDLLRVCLSGSEKSTYLDSTKLELIRAILNPNNDTVKININQLSALSYPVPDLDSDPDAEL